MNGAPRFFDMAVCNYKKIRDRALPPIKIGLKTTKFIIIYNYNQFSRKNFKTIIMVYPTKKRKKLPKSIEDYL